MNKIENIVMIECPFCENRYIFTVTARFLERRDGSKVNFVSANVGAVIECMCGATFAGEVVVK